MDWQDLLIDLYFKVCEAFESEIYMHTQRQNKNASSMKLSFTDQEAIIVYLFGLFRKQRTSKGIYTYTHDHLLSWFPTCLLMKSGRRCGSMSDLTVLKGP